MTDERIKPARFRNSLDRACRLARYDREQGPDRQDFVLRLFVSGMTPNSVRAIENARGICEGHLKGRYQLEIIDIYQQPQLAKDRQIVAAPTMVRELPLPLHRFIGDLSRTEQVLLELDISAQR